MIAAEFIVVLIFIFILLAVCVVMVAHYRGKGSDWQSAMDYVRTKLGGHLQGRWVYVAAEGAYYRIRYGEESGVSLYSSRAKSLPNLYVAVDARSGVFLHVLRESKPHRILEKAGLISEVKTGEAAFDNRFHIYVNRPEFGLSFFASPKNCEWVEELFRNGADEILSDGESVMACWNAVSLKPGTSLDRFVKSVAPLSEIAERLKRFMESSGGYFPLSRLVHWGAWAAGLASLGMFVALSAYPPLDAWKFFYGTLLVSVPVTGFSLFHAVIRCHNRSLTKISTAVLLWITAGIVSVFSAAVFINGRLDTSEERSHETRVLHTYVSERGSKSNTKYFAVVTSWRPKREWERLRVAPSEYERLIPTTSTLIVTTKPGRLGWEWKLWHMVDARDAAPPA